MNQRVVVVEKKLGGAGYAESKGSKKQIGDVARARGLDSHSGRMQAAG